MFSNPRDLNLRLIVEAPLRLFAPWLAMVLLATLAGQPGVVCVTPMAWLVALAVGRRCAAGTSGTLRPGLLEAGLAGALYGLLAGALFLVIVPLMGPVAVAEQASAVGLSLAMLCTGVPVSAGLSTFTAWLTLRRRPGT